jgi:CBS domain-containing protein
MKSLIKVEDLMAVDVRTCGPDDTLNEAAHLLWEHDCGAVPVVAGGRVVAMLTDRDICMAAYTQNRPLTEIPVSRAMSSELVWCAPDDSLDSALDAMRSAQVRRLPVVDPERRLKGLVSLNDIVRAASEPGSVVAPSDVVWAFAGICEPRRQLVEA